MHYLLRQGIAIRNDHAGGSNLSIELEKVLGESAWVTEGKYQSPECVNEMIEIMALRYCVHLQVMFSHTSGIPFWQMRLKAYQIMSKWLFA